jgi:hypothetical protein
LADQVNENDLDDNQVNLLKDVSIAFLSTSGLLLTLILGLIIPHMGQSIGTDVHQAVTLLIASSTLAACNLFLLAFVFTSKRAQMIVVLFFVAEAATFISALWELWPRYHRNHTTLKKQTTLKHSQNSSGILSYQRLFLLLLLFCN